MRSQPSLNPEVREEIRTEISRQNLLRELEAEIQSGQAAFVKMGAALVRIRDEQLYKPEYKDFTEYCEQRWQWDRTRAYQFIQAYQCHALLRESGAKVLPEREGPIRSLVVASLPAEDKQQAWEKAVDLADGGQPTELQVKQAIANVTRQPMELTVKKAKPAKILEFPEQPTPKVQPVSNTELLGMQLRVLEERNQRLEKLLKRAIAHLPPRLAEEVRQELGGSIAS